MNLDNPQLVAKYGSWMRVQVAFYDFLFKHDVGLCPTHFGEEAVKAFHDGNDFYENAVIEILSNFESGEHAWLAFVSFSLNV